MKMTKKEHAEYRKGFQSGSLHDHSDPLSAPNVAKCLRGRTSTEPLIRAYWLGYWAGMVERIELLKNRIRERIEYRQDAWADVSTFKIEIPPGWTAELTALYLNHEARFRNLSALSFSVKDGEVIEECSTPIGD